MTQEWAGQHTSILQAFLDTVNEHISSNFMGQPQPPLYNISCHTTERRKGKKGRGEERRGVKEGGKDGGKEGRRGVKEGGKEGGR